jgi:hypothetical protein
MALHPPAGGWQKLPWPFVLGIVLAAIGGCLVSLYKPAPGVPAAKSAITTPAESLEGDVAQQTYQPGL